MDEETAYHEAGHAMMAIYVGAMVESVTIDPDWDDGPHRYGDLTVLWPDRQLDQTAIENRIRVALAGPVVEMIHREEAFHPAEVAEWAQDWQEAWKWAGTLIEPPQKRLRYLEQMALDLYRFFNATSSWAATAAIVDNLLAHETLEGEEIVDIMTAWLQ